MNFYNEIKEQLINNEINKRIKDYSKNRSDLNTYYNIGKLLKEAGKHYGEGIIKEYSDKLKIEFGKQYTQRTLRRYRQFYNAFSGTNWSTMSTNLSWSHYTELLTIKDINKINFYIKESLNKSLSVRQLREKIKNKEYERLPEETKLKLIENQDIEIKDFVKNPIVIQNKYSYKNISEKVLQKLILEDIPSFLKELGSGFTFIENEYKIKIGDVYNYIDLLLFNYEYNCFIVVELKITELKKEHIGQIEVYMNYIDKNIKNVNQNKTIGLIIVKKDNKFVIEYASDKRILSRNYILN